MCLQVEVGVESNLPTENIITLCQQLPVLLHLHLGPPPGLPLAHGHTLLPDQGPGQCSQSSARSGVFDDQFGVSVGETGPGGQ